MLTRFVWQILVFTLSASIIMLPWAVALALCVVVFRWLVSASCGGA